MCRQEFREYAHVQCRQICEPQCKYLCSKLTTLLALIIISNEHQFPGSCLRFSNSQVNASKACVCTHSCASLTVCQCNWLHGRDLKCRHHTQSAVIVRNSSPSLHNQGRISCLGTASEERGSVCLLQFSSRLESQRATVPHLKRALGSSRPSVQTWHTLNSAKWHAYINKSQFLLNCSKYYCHHKLLVFPVNAARSWECAGMILNDNIEHKGL